MRIKTISVEIEFESPQRQTHRMSCALQPGERIDTFAQRVMETIKDTAIKVETGDDYGGGF